MSDVYNIIEKWKSSKEDRHKGLLAIFSRIFKLTLDRATVVLPSKLRRKAVKYWMDGDEQLVNDLESQTIRFVCNLVTSDTNIYNSVRGRRPNGLVQHSDSELVEKLAEESRENCDLCNYKEYTAEDVFGRLESPDAYTINNCFKYDGWHSMVAFRTHHPGRWSFAEVEGTFHLILQWFKKVHSLSPVHRFPIILWDMLPGSGASQIHPHLQMSLNRDQYYGELSRWYKAAVQYKQQYDAVYWTDLISVSTALGLTVSLGGATAIVNLTPKKGHEVILHCAELNTDLWRLLYSVIQAYRVELGQYCFSMAMVLPPLDCAQDPSQPVFARIVPRGSLQHTKSDICSQELFASPNVSVDPLQTVQVIQKTIRRLEVI